MFEIKLNLTFSEAFYSTVKGGNETIHFCESVLNILVKAAASNSLTDRKFCIMFALHVYQASICLSWT